MPIILALLFFYTVVPFFGVLLSYFNIYNYPFHNASIGDVLERVIFIIIFWSSLYFSYKKTNNNYCNIKNDGRYKMGTLLFLLFIVVSFVFYMSGYKFIFEGVSRGELRVSHGYLGPFYKLSIGFLIPIISALFAVCHFYQDKKTGMKKFYISIYFILIFIAVISTGYKSSAIYMLGPFFVVRYMITQEKKNIYLSLIFIFIFITLMTTIVRESGIFEAIDFLIYRIFYMASYGDMAFLSIEENAAFTMNYFYLNFLGKHLYWLFFDASSIYSYLEANLSTFVSLMVYPDIDSVLSGKTNVTASAFSESVFMLGNGFWLYAIVLGVYVGMVCSLTRKLFYEKRFVYMSLVVVYLFSVVMPWLNSGSFINLFSLFTLIYVVVTYIVITIFYRFKV